MSTSKLLTISFRLNFHLLRFCDFCLTKKQFLYFNSYSVFNFKVKMDTKMKKNKYSIFVFTVYTKYVCTAFYAFPIIYFDVNSSI